MSIFNIKVAKLNSVLVFDTAKLPEASRDYLLEYGLKQSLNDPHASISRTNYAAGELGDSEFLADVTKVVAAREAQIRTGQVPGSRSVVDPIRVAAANAGVSQEQVIAAIAAIAAKNKKAA